jgi:hypothetical protein
MYSVIGDDCTRIAYNGVVWVAVGYSASQGGRIGYSADGINWVLSPTQIFWEAYSPTWNGAVWVTAGTGQPPGYSPIAAYSYDGITWTESVSGSALSFSRAIGSDGNRFVALGQNTPYVYTSTDGITWSQTSTGSVFFNDYVFATVYNGRIWVAVGSSYYGSVAYSYDGIAWTTSASGSALFPQYCASIAWNGVIWVAAGYRNDWIGTCSVAYSYDGINWTASSSALALVVNASMVGWNGSVWTVNGYNEGFVYKILNSYDGITWTENTGASSVIGGVKSFGARRVLPYVGTTVVPPPQKALTENFTVIGSYVYGTNRIIYSYDGLTWQPSPSGNTIFRAGGTVECFGWNGATWLAGGISGTADGNHGRLATSPDGINWTLVTTLGGSGGAYTKFFQVASNGSMWIVLYSNLSSTEGYYSYDTITWTSTSVPGYATCIAASPSLWVSGGKTDNSQAAIKYSTDGINWITSSSAQSIVSANTGSVQGIGYNGSLWVAVGNLNSGSGAFAMYSPDGITWTQSNDFSSLVTGFMTIANPVWNGNVWVACCRGTNNIVYSYDAITWSAATSAASFFSYTYSVCWNGSRFICTGAAAGSGITTTVITSIDGISWSASPASSLIPTEAVGTASRRPLPYIGTMVKRSPLIQYGSGTSHASAFTLAVTFTTPFTTTPNITATVSNGSASWVSIGSASATGFTAYTWNASGGVSVPLNWTAIL